MGFLLVLSLLVLAGAWGVSWWARKVAARAQAVALVAPIPAAQLAEDAASVARELGPGSFRQSVWIRGRVRSDSPLIAELSHTLCVSYRFSVTREYEEVLWEKDPQGNSIQRHHRRSEVVASNEVATPFWLDDGTAKILVHPDQAKIEWVKSHASFQPATTPGNDLRVGSFVLNLGPSWGGTLGYRYEEFCLPVDQEVTVIAEAGDAGGKLALRVPEDRKSLFLITPKTFQEVVQGNRTMGFVLRGVSIGLTAVAVLIFLLGVVR